MASLDRLDVRSRKMLRGTVQGERRSKKRGASVEFADYRNYVEGDDFAADRLELVRHGWTNCFCVCLWKKKICRCRWCWMCRDRWITATPNKLVYAKQMVAALGYVALTHHNRLNLYSFSDTVLDQRVGMRGRRPIPEMVEFLNRQAPGGAGATAGDLSGALKRLSSVQRHPGIVVVVSDFFDKGDLSEAFKYLAGSKYDGYAVQLLSPQEVDPPKAVWWGI